MARKPSKEIWGSFEAAENKLPEIKLFAQEALELTEFTATENSSIILALEEAVSNIIHHAYDSSSGKIKLKLSIFDDRVSFLVTDNGRGFDFEPGKVIDLKKYVKLGKKGGLGLLLIQKIMDQVKYTRLPNENRLLLVKNLLGKKIKLPGLPLRWKFAFSSFLVVLVIILMAYSYFQKKIFQEVEQKILSGALQLSRTVAKSSSDLIWSGDDLGLSNLVFNVKKDNPWLHSLIVVDEKGKIWADPDNPEQILGDYLPSPELNPKLLSFPQKLFDGKKFFYHIIEPVILAEQKLGEIHLEIQAEKIEAEQKSSTQGLLYICLAGLFFGFFSVFLVSTYLVSPAKKLLREVQKAKEKAQDFTLSTPTKDELGEIAQAFNQMAQSFQENQKTMLDRERLEKELELAREVQKTLLPRDLPQVEGLEIATLYKPARQVGGDFFDFIRIDPAHLGIAIADVSGKGIPASLIMTMIRTALRLEALQNKSPREVLKKVHKFVSEDIKKGMFVTIFYAVYNLDNRQVSYASAGHSPVILHRAAENLTYLLNPRGLPVGLTLPEQADFGQNLKQETLDLEKDDLLVFYTDGIIEALNQHKHQSGFQKFLNFIQENSALAAEEFIARLNQFISDHTLNSIHPDDITLVTIKENLSLEEVIKKKRSRIQNLVTEEKKSLSEACSMLGMSKTLYDRLVQPGFIGETELKKLTGRKKPNFLALQQRESIVKIILEHPEFEADRIKKELNTPEYQYLDLEENLIKEELSFLKLDTKKSRLEYLEKQNLPLLISQKMELEKLSRPQEETTSPLQKTSPASINSNLELEEINLPPESSLPDSESRVG